MAVNDKANSSDQARSLAGDSQELLDASRSSVISISLPPEITTTEASYDPENPMPYFLSKESKHIQEATTVKKNTQQDDRAEFRIAQVEHTLSYQSIFCWILASIILVGGSLSAMGLTVDWNATTEDADLANSTIAASP